ncbi:hypothetical protein CW368_07300 [Actinomycetales bacterium SN12]|nr:hypothetical protein CW368_07300 [Actinomycetales bacterium SN12]
MPLTPDLLAIDAGQTGSKLRLRWSDGTIREDVVPGVFTDRPLVPQLAQIVGKVSHVTGAPRVVSIGVSGVTDATTTAVELMRHPDLAGVRRLLVAHDSVTSFLGVLGDRPGAVIAVGTGVVTLGVGPRRALRVDGWGNIMGDAGSGYWIGRQALEAVMRAHDHRGLATRLTELVRERWPDLEAAYFALQNASDRVRIVASFARATAELAADGDAIALGICLAAADELALSVTTALRETDAPADAAIGATGSVLRSTLIRDAFTQNVLAQRPEAHLVPAAGSGLDGAAALADLAPEHPLRDSLAEVSHEQVHIPIGAAS